MPNTDQQAYLAALQWHLDHGADELFEDEPQDRTQSIPFSRQEGEREAGLPQASAAVAGEGRPSPGASVDPTKFKKEAVFSPLKDEGGVSGGTPALKQQSMELAANAGTLEELAEAIQNFEGLDIKKTATNFVFCDGNPKAKVMLVGEAPGADEDRQGKPFVGVSGQLLDKILACIDLDRQAEEPEKSIYISNILNWRPPGNRTPTPQEMEIAKPFIEKHIAFIQPEVLIFCGGVAAQTLLHTKDSISRLRGKAHEFSPQTVKLTKPVPAIATYHPAYLLRTPSQKAKVWQDMLFLKQVMSKKYDI